MKQLSSNQDILNVLKAHADNLNLSNYDHLNSAKITKSALGNAMKLVVVNLSLQLNKNILDDVIIFSFVQSFYDSFPLTNDWMDSVNNSVNKHLNRKVG